MSTQTEKITWPIIINGPEKWDLLIALGEGLEKEFTIKWNEITKEIKVFVKSIRTESEEKVGISKWSVIFELSIRGEIILVE